MVPTAPIWSFSYQGWSDDATRGGEALSVAVTPCTTAVMGAGIIRVGIGGWSFPPWRGVFYPPGLAQSRELGHAATRVQAIEINATFYGSQSPDSFRRWAAATPPGFVFSVKAARGCTHRRVLAETGESIERFLGQGLTELGDRLGPILWAFPATKRFDPEDFASFLSMLPAARDGIALRHAIEVRHDSFADHAFADLARTHGVAVVRLDPTPIPHIVSGDFTYARLQGMREEEATGYDASALDGWAHAAKGWAGGGDAFVFMINGAKVRAPAAAEALIARLS